MLFGQKHHADAVFTGRRQCHALARHFLAKELIRDLDQHARAIAHQGVSAHRTTVIEIAENLRTLLDDAMAFLTLDMGDKTHAARIVFVHGIVEPLNARDGWLRTAK